MNAISDALLAWYDKHARTMPWRVGPKARRDGHVPNPYHVWLSEVMLQQTQVATVRDYFVKFVTKWPQLSDLAAADTEEVMKAWAGLGYYSRARNLKKCAEVVVLEHGGVFPQTHAELLKLPGIGDYTASAIAAIAFNKREAVVDGNIERVVSRLLADATPLPALKANVKAEMALLTPAERPGDFAQAMMDLGATICTPKKPACALCPLNAQCEAFKCGEMEHFPVKAPKKAKPVRKGAAFVAIGDDGNVWLRKRAETGLLGGMSEVPTTDWTSRQDGETGLDAAPFAGEWHGVGVVTHTFTHFHLELAVFCATLDRRQIAAINAEHDGWWADEPAEEALPTVMRKVLEAALPGTTKRQAPNRKVV